MKHRVNVIIVHALHDCGHTVAWKGHTLQFTAVTPTNQPSRLQNSRHPYNSQPSRLQNRRHVY